MWKGAQQTPKTATTIATGSGKEDGDVLETCFVDKGAVLSLLFRFLWKNEESNGATGFKVNNWGSKHPFWRKDLSSVTVCQDYTGKMHRFLSKILSQ